MTIFQKMILVPVLSLLIYSGFVVYSFLEQQRITSEIENLRDDYMPVSLLVKDNIRNFEELGNVFKDAVLAGESKWIEDTVTIKQKIENSLILLRAYPHIIEGKYLAETTQAFFTYYNHASSLAEAILNSDQEDWSADEEIAKNATEFSSKANQHFMAMELIVDRAFKASIDKSYNGLNYLLFWGGAISAFSMIFLLIVTLCISFSTRNNIFQLVLRAKSLAQGEVNFSRRLERAGNDELSELIYWFNKLSDKLEEDYKQLETISITDKLTGLNNRTRTDQFLPVALSKAAEESYPLHAVVLDIDHFKSINDNYGHLVGDQVLQQFSEILRKHADCNDFIGRWGGEEFILVWQETTQEQAIEKANSLRQSIEQADYPEVGRVTASLGVTKAKTDDNPQTLVERADQALYKAKTLGRNRVHYIKDII